MIQHYKNQLSWRLIWLCDCGSAMVECAIILPVFLVLVGGVLEFGFYFYQQQLVESGVRDAARYLALTSDPTNTINQSSAKNLAVYGLASGDIAPRVSGWSTADVTVSVGSIDNSAGTYSGGPTIRIVSVSTSFADPSLGFFRVFGFTTPDISVSHQERSVGGSALVPGRS
jgi:adhesin HecA-like repeat protein